MNLRAALLVLAFAAALGAVLFVRPQSDGGPPMRDFEAYDAAGAMWNSGGDPYSAQIWRVERTLPGVDAHRYAPLPFVAPPAALPVFGLIARLRPAQAIVLWRLVLAACAAMLGLRSLVLAGLPVTPLRFLTIALAMLGFGPLTSAISLGQLALPAYAFAVLSLAFPLAAAAAWLQPNVALVLLANLTERSRVLLFAAPLALFAAACAAVAGIHGLLHYAAVVRDQGIAERFSAIQITPEAIVYGMGASPRAAAAAGLAISIAAAAIWALGTRSMRDPVTRFAFTCALVPLAMPFFHEHDLIVVFVPAVIAVVRASPKTLPLALFAALALSTDWLGLAQRPTGALQQLLLTAACGGALLSLRRDIRVRDLAAAGAVLLLVAGASGLASAHPVPVWPDAMRPLSQAAARMDAAHVWHAEQQATGLLARSPVWVLLRLLSLAGCALTALAIAVSSRYPVDSRRSSPVPA